MRHQLVTHLVNYMQRLGFPPNASLEHKKLSVDLAEVIIKWELQRIKEDENETKYSSGCPMDEDIGDRLPLRRGTMDFSEFSHRKKLATEFSCGSK